MARRALCNSVLPARARLALLLALAGARSKRRREVVVPLPTGDLFIGRLSPLIDVTTVLDVWRGTMFPAHCGGRVVLDLGGHKGYFGAWALAHGATMVISCEPEPENYSLLERCRARNQRRDAWEVKRVAVGAAPGRATLYRSNESWAHSLYDHMVTSDGSVEVEVVGLASILDRAHKKHPNAEVVLKVNIEGAAGDVLFAVEPARLSSVVEVHLDQEPGSPSAIEDILRHLAAAGLTEVSVHDDQLHRIIRP
jgi:FkbM family methyltransferase